MKFSAIPLLNQASPILSALCSPPGAPGKASGQHLKFLANGELDFLCYLVSVHGSEIDLKK
jgi:hypothetical protein